MLVYVYYSFPLLNEEQKGHLLIKDQIKQLNEQLILVKSKKVKVSESNLSHFEPEHCSNQNRLTRYTGNECSLHCLHSHP